MSVSRRELLRTSGGGLLLTDLAKRLGLGIGGAVGPLPTDEGDARSGLIPFTQRLYPQYRPSRHHHFVAQQLEAVVRGDTDRVILVMPPRHGKSELASVNLPPFFLGHNPDWRIICCSHTASLAYRFSRQARAKLEHPAWPFPEVRLSSRQRAVQQWEIEGRRGGYTAAGVGGPITGLGADLLIIDDPVKSAEEARSKNVRENLWDWWQGTANTRLQRGGRVIVIGTRWHHDDLIGRLIKHGEQEGEPWTVVHLPALALTDRADPLGRAPGEPLWPEEYDVPWLERKRREIGGYQFGAQYQGMPTDEEGGVFKKGWWVRYLDSPQEVRHRLTTGPVLFLDTAYGKNERGAFSVIAVWGVVPPRSVLIGPDAGGRVPTYLVLDVWRGQPEFPALRGHVLAMAGAWNPTQVVIEDKASGQSLIQQLRADTTLPIIAWDPGDRDKETRAHAVSGIAEAGRVGVPDGQAWLDAWIEEHAAFPYGEAADQVDTTSMALLRLARGGGWEDVPEDLAETLEGLGL